jgi:RNA polymerase sigma factor (sigma-70 family)
MVFRLCRRVLGDGPDAEDAFQAAFLVLLRKAGSLGRPESLANWLYGVAYRTAVKTRAQMARRRVVESRAVCDRTAGPDDDLVWRDLDPVLDREIQRLSDKYRAPFVLCHLEGRTSAEAARLLRCPEGTVLSRISRARALLRDRLSRRGISLGAGLLAVLAAEAAAPAAVPRALVEQTIRAGMASLADRTAAAGFVSAALRKVVRTMLYHKGKVVAAALLLLGAAGFGSAVVVPATPPDDPPKPAAAASEKEPPSRAEAEKAVTASLKRSYQSYVEAAQVFWDPGVPIPLTAVFSPVPAGATGPQEWKGNWDRMAAALGPAGAGRRYQVQVKVFKDGTDKAVWSGRQPIDPAPLARRSHDTVSDGKTVLTMYDPDALTEFRLPAGALTPATYRVTLSFLDPDGAEHQFPNGSTPESGPLLVIRPAPLDMKALLLPGRSADAADMLTRATEVANPGRRQFPKDDPDDCQARSVWCLQEFQGRVYVGYGDWDKNRGPIDVWSFGPDSAETRSRYPGRYSFAAGDGRLLFTKEYTVQEESVDRFRVLGDKLVIPGVDGNKANGPDFVAFSNVYIREKGSWRKLSSLSGGHVMDAADFGGRLLAAVAGVKASADGGLSWQDLVPGQPVPGAQEFVPFRGGLLIFGDGEGGSFYRDGKLETRVMDFFPGYGYNRAHRSTPFLGGVVYTTHHSWGRTKETRHPLFFLEDFKEGPKVVEPFRDRAVSDIKAEGDRHYVLSWRAESGGFVGETHSTRDLRDWTRVAAFRVPAIPSAFARLGGSWYVGLANRGYDPAKYDEHRARTYAFADKAAGTIYCLSR